MASGTKEGPPPPRLYVIKSGYEIRYYTTPDTMAQAIVDGYGNFGHADLALYELRPIDPKQVVAQVMAANPEPARPVMPPRQNFVAPLTPEEKALLDPYNRAVKDWRKKVKALLTAAIDKL